MSMNGTNTRSASFWIQAWKRLLADPVARICGCILAIYLVVALLSATGLIAKGWNDEVGVSYANPVFAPNEPNPEGDTSLIREDASVTDDETKAIDPLAPKYEEIAKLERTNADKVTVLQRLLPLGGDKTGRDVLAKTIKAGQISIAIGLAASFIAVFIGVVLGAFSGYFGGKVNDALEWVYNVFTSVPYILLVLAFSAVLGKGVGTVILVLGMTGWTGTYRLIRSEYIKHRDRDYVQAANAIGASHLRMMFLHILPNVSHLILIQLSQEVISFIKAEVVLSFLGFGVPVDLISWGIMISDVRSELVIGKWWQLASCATAMSVFVVAFSFFTDSLRDALDPKSSRR